MPELGPKYAYEGDASTKRSIANLFVIYKHEYLYICSLICAINYLSAQYKCVFNSIYLMYYDVFKFLNICKVRAKIKRLDNVMNVIKTEAKKIKN